MKPQKFNNRLAFRPGRPTRIINCPRGSVQIVGGAVKVFEHARLAVFRHGLFNR
jgi:hypothetical protein